MAWKVALNNLNLNLIPTLLTFLCISSSVIAQEIPTVTSKNATIFTTTTPNNTRVITDDGANAENISSYPVAVFENHTYWPLSYTDNRFSFALVVTENDKPNYTYVNTIEAEGARYIKRIYTNTEEETVVFVGQGGREAAVGWDTLRQAASEDHDHIKATGTSSTASPASSGTATASTAPPPKPKEGKGESITGAVAGGAFGGLVVLVVLVIVVWKCWFSPKKESSHGKSGSHHGKGSVNLSTVSRSRTRDGNQTLTSFDDADERAAEARRLGGIPDWQAQTAYARAMSPVERSKGPRGGYHYPFKGDDRA
ncbi:hypothetical protein V8F20_003983 [Naviculisporaceae sp. PSN 640]